MCYNPINGEPGIERVNVVNILSLYESIYNVIKDIAELYL